MKNVNSDVIYKCTLILNARINTSVISDQLGLQPILWSDLFGRIYRI